MGRAGGSGGRSGGGGGSFSGGNRSGGGRSSFSSGRSGSSSSSGSSTRSTGSSSGLGSSSSRSSGSSGGGLFGSSSSSNRSGGGRSSSSSSRNSSSGGFFGSNNNTQQRSMGRGNSSSSNRTTIFVNNQNHSNNRYDQPRGYSSGYTGGRTNNSGCGMGCGKLIVLMLIAILILALIGAILMATGGSNYSVTPSTIVRQPLPAGSVNETAYYTDELGWIGNETTLLKGLKNFYRATGVQPYLYITDNVNGEHIEDPGVLADYASLLYDELFTDEGHLLFIFYEYNDDYADYYLCGAQAKSVIDREAGDILLDYIDKYYYTDGMTDEEFFSKSFDDAATRIMTVERSPWINVIYVSILLIAVIVIYRFWTQRAKQKLKKAEQDAKILETPLEKFGDTDLKDLEKKYTTKSDEEE